MQRLRLNDLHPVFHATRGPARSTKGLDTKRCEGCFHRDHEICSSTQSLRCQFSLPTNSPSNPSLVA